MRRVLPFLFLFACGSDPVPASPGTSIDGWLAPPRRRRRTDGRITITKVVVEGDNLTTFAATHDAEVVAKDAQPEQWNGKLTGSWQ